jgi:hypothetical protein
VPHSVTSPHQLRSHDEQLARARAVLVDPAARAYARVGAVELPLGLVVVAAGRLVVTVGDDWRWPHDEPDAAGEVYVDGRATDQPEVRLVGWWSPLTELRSAPLGGDVTARSTVLWLDAVEALITQGASRVHLTEPAILLGSDHRTRPSSFTIATRADWLLR